MLSTSGLAALETYADSQRAYRVFSFGGGVQSTAVLVLAAQGLVHYDAFVFSNVGNDSENPATLNYIEQHAKPFAAKHGLNLVEVQKMDRHGKPVDLYTRAMRNNKQIPIPARLESGKPANRVCTDEHKVRVIDKWIKAQGIKYSVVGLGISTDELYRLKVSKWRNSYGKRKLGFWKLNEYPLFNLLISRQDCHRLINEAGLPTPPRSACFFCPFMKIHEWKSLMVDSPDLYNKAIRLEKHLQQKGHGKVTLARNTTLEALRDNQVINPQLSLFSDETMDMCESGYCHT